MPGTNQAPPIEQTALLSLEGMPREVLARIASHTNKEGRHSMMLLNKRLHRDLASFYTYRKTVTAMLGALELNVDINQLIPEHTDNSTLRQIYARLNHLLVGCYNEDARNINESCEVYSLSLSWLLKAPADFFACVLTNNASASTTPPSFEKLITAILISNKPLLDKVKSFDPSSLLALWHDDDDNKPYRIFLAACLSGEFDLASQYVSLEQQQTMLAKNKFYAFKCAVQQGNINTLQRLWDLCPDDRQQTMLSSKNFTAFHKAAENGHLNIVQWLWDKCPEDQQQAMLGGKMPSAFSGFYTAAMKGHLAIAQWLWERSDKDLKQRLLSTYFFKVFKNTAARGLLSMTQWLWKICPKDQQQAILVNRDFSVFHSATGNGHLDTAQWLWSNCSKDQQQAMLVNSDFRAFYEAASRGHLTIVQWLWEKFDENMKQHILATHFFDVFENSAAQGHLPMIQWLWERCSNAHQQKLLTNNDFYVFIWAAENDHLETFQWLYEQASLENKQKVQDIFKDFGLPVDFKQQLFGTLPQPDAKEMSCSYRS